VGVRPQAGGQELSAFFAALPVAQGDAFLVSSDSFSALIDGGHSRVALPTLLSKERRSRSLTVLACTHNDADHAEGLIGLLQDQRFSVSEVWLPGQWTARLRDLLVGPEAFLGELLHQIVNLGDEAREASLTDLAERYREPIHPQDDNPPTAELLDDAVESRSRLPAGALRRLAAWWLWWWRPFHDLPAKLLWEAVEAAERIRQLAYLAWERATIVRWFDVNLHPDGTHTEPLCPVNAKEIVRVQRTVDALRFLALSVSNGRGLCFQFRPGPTAPGVLLTGDSDLKFSASISWLPGMVVTAPHHGSEANAFAYHRASNECSSVGSLLWVRSDGKFRSRPGATFLQQTHRYCTLCRPYSQGPQTVRLAETGGVWGRKQAHPCRCT